MHRPPLSERRRFPSCSPLASAARPSSLSSSASTSPASASELRGSQAPTYARRAAASVAGLAPLQIDRIRVAAGQTSGGGRFELLRAHAWAACAVPSRYVRDVPDQVQRESCQRATTPICPE